MPRKWKPGPAATYDHGKHVIVNVNKEFRGRLSTGQRVADAVARIVGGWPFIITQSAIILVWVAVNGFLLYQASASPSYFKSWDPYPFILLNLVLSFQAAYTGPIVMMSQNRQQDIDRKEAAADYQINIKAELEIELLHQKIDELREKEVLALTAAVESLIAQLQEANKAPRD